MYHYLHQKENRLTNLSKNIAKVRGTACSRYFGKRVTGDHHKSTQISGLRTMKQRAPKK